ncbi:MAG: class I SAM-dependent methyltransferase [Dehalococcoidia bacterium]
MTSPRERLHLVLERIRPFPTPRYRPTTPKRGSSDPWDPFFPPNAHTLGAAAMSSEAALAVAGVVGKLSAIEQHTTAEFFYRWGMGLFGQHWRHADQLTTLWAAATLIQPGSYLEVGVCRGRSAAVVGALRPQCAIYGFDMWIPDYAGAPNPGPDFVRDELRAAGHQGELVLESGDSRATLPAFLARHPDLYFDLITVDGDKSVLGVAHDYANALPRLKVGGIVVTDDIAMFPRLRRVWDRVIERDGRFVSWEYAEGGRGVAAAIRVRA